MYKKLFIMLSLFGALTFIGEKCFAASGDVSLSPAVFDLSAAESFEVFVYVDTGGEDLGVFNMYLDFDTDDIEVDTSEGEDGIEAGSAATSYRIDVNTDNLSSGHYRFAGVCAENCANGSNVQIVKIYLKTTATFNSGSSDLSLRVNELSNTLGTAITTGSISGATVNVTSTDSSAPVISNLSPSEDLSSGTNSVTLSLSTNESATCKYSTNSGTSYASMTGSFSTTGGTIHSTTVTGLNDGNSYNYYIRCSDSSGNINTSDSVISFSVDSANSDSSDSSDGSSSEDTSSDDDNTSNGSDSSNSSNSSSDSTTSSNSNNNSSSNTSSNKKTNTFTKHLVLGTENEEVRVLQQTLNSLGYTVSATGLGSPGNETAYFGKKTLNALNAFQRAHNIPVTSSLDSTTRALLNNTSVAKASKTTTRYSWSRNLTIGSRGTDVLNLQKVLISKGYLTIKNPTTYFGPLTKSALIKYQRANGIAPAVGYFGPITRSHINKHNSGIGGTSKSTQGELSLKEIVNLFLALGIISEDKRDLALATVNAVE